ncbi:hypothetical protein [Azospirillum soli]|uniref:hypothetical protein n=1 Tax=Azospirillum soli TaxID=1304799 RepID=UPI001AE6EC30|nr:hypothetical protein [Azospirillum soli]MBP2312588.1 hypothetical protein [Azospirillum soli]
MNRPIGVRWTIGDVSPRGFEALRLSIWGAWRLFGPEARYAVVVNSLTPEAAQRRTGAVPDAVEWRTAGGLPDFLRDHLDAEMAEGVAWKFAPLRCFPDRYELSLDNDCILWDLPEAMRAWLEEAEPRCLVAADVTAAFGAFAGLTRDDPRNMGIRGLPPGHDLGAALWAVLARHPVPLRSELDEQGLQVVALDLGRPAHVVSTADVNLCSPFWPKVPELGRAGAHFVGLNARNLPWNYYDRPATECVIENWRNHRPELYRRVGLAEPVLTDA